MMFWMRKGLSSYMHVGTGPMAEEEQIYVRHYHIEQYWQFVGTLDAIRLCL
jgi:hypothetical protein